MAEKVVGAWDDDDGVRGGPGPRQQWLQWRLKVRFAVDQHHVAGQGRRIVDPVAVDGANRQSGQNGNSRRGVLIRQRPDRAGQCIGPKRKAHQRQWGAMRLVTHGIYDGKDVLRFANAIVIHACACTHAAKAGAYRKPSRIPDAVRQLVRDLVARRAAHERLGMGDDRHAMNRLCGAIKKQLEWAGGARYQHGLGLAA